MSRSSFKRQIAVTLASAVLLTACQSSGNRNGLFQSSITTELPPEASKIIAGDMVAKLAETVGPGQTTIRMTADDSSFAHTLEAALRNQGYAVATDQKIAGSNIVALSFVIDQLESDVLVRISTSEIDLTRMYKVGEGGATAVSPISVRQG